MINSVADFLENLKAKEQDLLKKYEIVQHPGIIGSMYEGLTKDLLGKGIFKGLDLKIAAGKIRNSKNELSGEIDCMIVIGDGESIPYTDKFIYEYEKVIAVIQVKKNLYSKEIKDSYQNLKTVVDISDNSVKSEHYHYRLMRDSWRAILREELPDSADVPHLTIQKQMMYQVFLDEVFLPIRIVWGYNGFKSEFALRESFINYLSENAAVNPADPDNVENSVSGFGPISFPNLVICDKYSLVKCTGMPFGYPVDEKGNWWMFFNSSHENPLYLLLELIWTRLHYKYRISSDIFGDDLTTEEMHGFLLGRYKVANKTKGWEYYYVDTEKQVLEQPLNHKEWEPTYVDEIQFLAFNKLCRSEIFDAANDSTFIEFISKAGYTLDTFLAAMKSTGLVDVTNGVLKLITEKCVCGVTRDGRLYAADDKTGRVTRWTFKHMK